MSQEEPCGLSDDSPSDAFRWATLAASPLVPISESTAHSWHVTKAEAAPGHRRMGSGLELMRGERHMVIGFACNQDEFQARGLEEGKSDTTVMENVTVGPRVPDLVDRIQSASCLATLPRVVP